MMNNLLLHPGIILIIFGLFIPRIRNRKIISIIPILALISLLSFQDPWPSIFQQMNRYR